MDMEHNFGDSAWNQVEENKRLQDEQVRYLYIFNLLLTMEIESN